MADLGKVVEVTRGLTTAIKNALNEEDESGSEQVVWTYKMGEIVTTTQHGEGVKFKIIAYTELYGIPGYQLEQIRNASFKPVYPETSLKKD